MVDPGPAYERWRRTPLPSGTLNEEVDELHADLAMWDAFVADAVIPMADGRQYDPGVHDQAAEVENLRQRIEVVMREAVAEDREQLRLYREYCDLLQAVISVAAEGIGGRGRVGES
jgi:hypothetical protein